MGSIAHLEMEIRPPLASEITVLARFFNDFCVFYGRPDDPSGALTFVEACYREQRSFFYVAMLDGRMAGFSHLIPYLDTLRLSRAWILEDFFVEPSSRRKGVGSALLRHASRLALADGSVRLTLTTAHTNLTAQRLYEAHGYVMDDVFRIYNLAVRP